MMMKSIVSILLFILVALQSVQSQSSDWIKTLKAQFEGDSLWWTSQYSGSWADFHNIKITLGFDGETYNGWIEYPSSNTKYELVGEPSEEQSILFEIDNLGRQCGIIEAKITDTRIEGVWWNRDLSHQANIKLLNSAAIPIQKFKPTIAQYVTKEMTNPATLLIHREAPSQVNGYLYITGRPFSFSFSGNCKNTPCTKWTADLFDETGMGGTINGISEKDGSIKIDFIELDSMPQRLTFNLQERADVQLKTYTNFLGSIDLSTIDIGSEIFTNFIHSKTMPWWEKALSLVDQKDELEVWTSEDRQRNVFNGWLEIGYIDRSLITGILVLTGGSKSESFPFAFNRYKDVFLDGGDIFQNNINIDQARKEWVSKNRANLITEQALTYDEWIQSATFDHSFFRADGWVIVSDFDPIYGTAEIVVSFEDIKTQLKKKSLIHSIYK